MLAEPLRVESKEPISVVCYVRSQDEEVALGMTDLRKILRSSVWVILAMTLLGTLIAGAVALALPPVYRAETTLAIVQSDQQGAELSNLAGNLGGLASLAGIRLPSAGDDIDKTMAEFKSRAFTDKFIQDKDLLPVLYPNLWDPNSHTWRVRPGSSRMPTVLKAYKFFDDDIRAIDLDRKAGLVTLDIEWRDPRLAAEWANDLVKRINKYEQQEAISEANRSMAFLQQQLLATRVAEMRQLIYGLIYEQMRTVMLATVRDDYAFQVIDPALVPERPTRPRVAVIVTLGSIVGLLVGVLLAIYRSRFRAPTDLAGSSKP